MHRKLDRFYTWESDSYGPVSENYIRKTARCFWCFPCLIGGKAGKAPRRKAATLTDKQITNWKARKAKAQKISRFFGTSLMSRGYNSLYTCLHGITEN